MANSSTPEIASQAGAVRPARSLTRAEELTNVKRELLRAETTLARMFHEADFAGSFLLRGLHFVDLAQV